MDPIKVKVHHEANLWQAQRNLMGMGECKWTNDLGQFPTTPRYHLLGPEAQEGHLALAHKTRHFPFSHGFVLIPMMYFIYRMQVRWMGFMSLSP
jgi:hypothetical protein